MDILNKIVNRKKERLKYTKSRIFLNEIKSKLPELEASKNFTNAIKRDNSGIKLIAEIKKASPSKGIIKENFDIERIAKLYTDEAIDAISVITEEDFFKGHLDFIPYVKGITSKAILRKDFIIDGYQIYESKLYKADAILLIAAILSKGQAEEYLHIASEIGLAVLFEVHDEDELQIALDIKAPIIGINNRNLKTMEIDLSNTLILKRYIPSDKIVVAESGIKNKDDVISLNSANIDALLVGTSIMQTEDVTGKIRELKMIY